ncbi:DUF998 domain-containing protein [Asticcacaulis biprosthecium]|uniref:DUF998 domain-containing protein n=1 Tax=Asticcacaulis biprosthecium TaxID=76891 RepID=UPI0012F4B84A|nr:DUF998 domain-containing protein [Asticcacaulis biprosthecium]
MTGITGALLAIEFPIIGDLATPDYDALRQFISELGAGGATNAQWINHFGFLPAGVLLTSFSVLAWMALPRKGATTAGFLGTALYAIGYIAAVFFPCGAGCAVDSEDPVQLLHNFFGIAGYLTAPGALICFAIGARAWPDANLLSRLGWVYAAVAALGLAGLMTDLPYRGLWQRILEAGVLIWCLTGALYLARQPFKSRSIGT